MSEQLSFGKPFFIFNVEYIEVALETVKNFGIDAAINYNDWGNTINIFDPDGNRVGIRDEATFSE